MVSMGLRVFIYINENLKCLKLMPAMMLSVNDVRNAGLPS